MSTNYKCFEDWFFEQESYGLRCERFPVQYDEQILGWLKEAWYQGKQVGIKITIDAIDE